MEMEEPSPLLRLTPLIRRRIYSFVGLVSWDPLQPHKFDLHGRDTLVREQPKASAFHGLLLSCRAIYSEAAPLLYSASRFVLHYTHDDDPDPLRPLRALTLTSLASLTALTIVLNQASCHHDFDHRGYHSWCCLDRDQIGLGPADHCKRNHTNAHSLPLLAPSPAYPKPSDKRNDNDNDNANDAPFAAAQQLLANWHSAAARLSHITSGQLDLGLVCDIDPHHERALELATSAIAPLRWMPKLRACHIRLSKTPDPHLQRVAQDAVLQALRIPTPPYSKPSTKTTFITLPAELRLQILEYTDLIIPSREVTWSRQDQGYLVFARESNQSPDRKYRVQFSPCTHYEGDHTLIGCFCRRRHTAFSLTCKCWAPPGPALFLVCRTLCRDAQVTFFSGNHFIVHDYWADPAWTIPFVDMYDQETRPERRYEYPYERLGASQFLRHVVPPHCLAYLRFLELVFPQYLPESWPQAEQPAMKDWQETIEWAKDKIQAPSLTIRLVGAEHGDWGVRIFTDTMTTSEGDAIMRSFQGLLKSLKPLADNGLARFYAHIPYPWRFVGEPQPYMARWDWVSAQERALKERAERFIMGDRYEEQYANGSEEPRLSFWTWTRWAQD
ncbi:hypothetical protein F5144DRAFT_334135 [Chaetomium tenue]|uniref:Uncharacterized protein n=1 Tax=Chaetomium tenue TaxID=1854479 RepID=A0ACB7NW07_9PEZI|nr:hypothetical protein F5144DRAFT_334135 [Chaetomium globosum]